MITSPPHSFGQRRHELLTKLTALSLFLLVSLALLLATFVLEEARKLPANATELTRVISDSYDLATEIYDRNGEKIGEIAGERRYFVPLSSVPKSVIQAFLSAEDQDFYDHYGLSLKAVARSLITNLRQMKLSQGGSTITQQVARAYYLSREKTWGRKIREASLALILESRLGKDEILELYLNKIFLGNHSYGIEAASRNYFRKSVKDLSLGEAALLASLPKGPSYYALNRHPERASKRQAWVLDRMVAEKFISRKEARYWKRHTVWVAKNAQDLSEQAPYFIAAVRDELMRKFEFGTLPKSGLKVFTTLDVKVQKRAQAETAAALQRARKNLVHGVSGKVLAGPSPIEAALVSIDPRTGAVIAMQGGENFRRSQFNRAKNASRALGALMMPIYSSLALERGYDLSSSVDYDPLAPNKALRPDSVSIYEALVDGRIFDGARLFTALGSGSIKQHAERLGLKLPLPARGDDILLAVGYGAASPEAVAYAYSTFANGGRRISPYLVTRIEGSSGKVLYQQRPPRGEAVLAPQAAFLTTSALQHAARYGKQRGLLQPALARYREAGGMAGASEDLHDSWYVGMLPNLVTTVWIGAENGSVRLAPSEDDAARLAADLWGRFTLGLPQGIVSPEQTFTPPSQVGFGRLKLSKPVGTAATRTLPFWARM